MPIKEIFGNRLSALRKQAGESREALGEILSVSTEQIRLMEIGKRASTFEKLVLICEHYQVSADYLLGLSDEPQNPTIRRDGD